MGTRRVVAIAAAFLNACMVVGCGPNPVSAPDSGAAKAPAPAAKKEPVLYTGKPCLTRMVDLAARWQPDAMPFHMESALNAESTGRDGKSTIWRALFASPSRGAYKTFICSGSRLAEAPPVGITSTAETPYGANVPQLMFQPFYLTADSDQAFSIAQERGGAKLLEKDPQQPVLYSLNWDPRQKQLLWVVIYGTTQDNARGIGVINASTGKFVRAGK